MKKNDINMTLGQKKELRHLIVKIIILVAFSFIGLRMFYLQVYKYNKYSYLSQKNRFKKRRLIAERGKFYDVKGRLIVTNGAGYRLIYLNGRKQNTHIVQEISEITGYSQKYISSRIKNGEIFPYTKENILIDDLNENLAHILVEKIQDYPYLEVESYSKRRYLEDSMASHLLGYVKKISKEQYEKLKDLGYTKRDIIGKDGLEKKYDKFLQGKDGFEQIEINALNRVQRKTQTKISPIPGKDLHLTVDSELQKYVEELFREGHYSGAFIALNPKNGEVITMVSYPTFSLNTFSSQISQEEWNEIQNDPQKPLSNKATTGLYPPGSTFKLVSAMAFLTQGVSPYEIYNDRTGIYTIGKYKWKAWKKGGHGKTDMKKSIVESANPYYYHFSDKVGHKPIVEVADKFGFGQKTNIDIPRESKGLLPTTVWKKRRLHQGWYKGDTILLSIGQGYLLVTPLQVADLYEGIANRGVIYRPHLVKYIEDNNGNKFPVKIEKKIIRDYPKKYYDILEDALIATVDRDDGTAKILRTKGIKVAAKSGSAQNSHSKITHAWVAGYFPSKNPEVVFTAILENSGAGGKIAGGMVKKFIDKYYEIKERESNGTKK